MKRPNLWARYPTLEAAVQALPEELQQLLNRHEATILCSDWLKRTHPLAAFRSSISPAVFQWDVVGLALASRNRLHEAISIHRELYYLLCEAQHGYRWIHKGLPLVRLRDWHRQLGHPWHEDRYLILTLVEDSIRDHGTIDVEKGGIYHRFRWEDGRPDAEFRMIARRSWQEYTASRDLRSFPEEILARIGPGIYRAAASQNEVDLFEINTAYAAALFDRAARGDWRALERLAVYQLTCIPGFDVERQRRSEASVFDVFVRVRGTYADFRRELGVYLLGECKNWQKPVGPDVIAYLAQNLIFHECTTGILFSWNGITGRRENKYAALTVLRAYHHSGRIILVLDQKDFKAASRGAPLQELLRAKYELVRFGSAGPVGGP